MNQNRANIHERSNNIIIKKPNDSESSLYLVNQKSHEYGLKQNNFYPCNSSPPNHFILKLKQRLSKH
jgi:hypothetical protein